MNYGSLLSKLDKGVALADRGKNAREIKHFNSEIEQQLLQAAIRTKQVDKAYLLGLGQLDLMAQLQTGEFLPNDFMGWSTKTILAIVTLLLLVKVKRLKK